MYQLLGDFVPQTPYRGFAPGPHCGTSVPQTPLPPGKIPVDAQMCVPVKIYLGIHHCLHYLALL